MNTKYLMIVSAIIMGALGASASFFPNEILDTLGIASNELVLLCLQLMSALYLGFAIMNWMAKTVLIGGIYAKPLSMGNFFHFAIGAIILIKLVIHNPASPKFFWAICIIYSILAVLFGMVLFKNTLKNNSGKQS
ncbi:MAG: hypothetical protein ABIN36_06305 [Ferruginibacter sp.]